jgi:hypothetical protein
LLTALGFDPRGKVALSPPAASVVVSELPAVLAAASWGFLRLLHPPFLARAAACPLESPETRALLSALQALPADVVTQHILPRALDHVRPLLHAKPAAAAEGYAQLCARRGWDEAAPLQLLGGVEATPQERAEGLGLGQPGALLREATRVVLEEVRGMRDPT